MSHQGIKEFLPCKILIYLFKAEQTLHREGHGQEVLERVEHKLTFYSHLCGWNKLIVLLFNFHLNVSDLWAFFHAEK